MVGRKTALVMGTLLVLPTVVLGINNDPNVVADMVDAGVTVSKKDKAQKKNLSSALQTLIHRFLKAKDMVTDPDGAKRELESRAWFTNMQEGQVKNEEKENIFEERAAGKPKSGKKNRTRKKSKKKAAGRRRKKNRGKGKGGRSRGRGQGEFGARSVLMKSHDFFKKIHLSQTNAFSHFIVFFPGKGEGYGGGEYGGKGRSKGGGASIVSYL